MIELLSTYSITQIVIFLTMIILAAKELLGLTDWIKERVRKYFNKESSQVTTIESLEQKNREQDEKIGQILCSQQKILQDIENLSKSIQNLISSDRDSIKAYITKEHHFFCYEAGWIDDYNLDVLERRYKHYKDEGGNSFIDSMMDEIRSLPKQPSTNNVQ